MPLIRAVTKGKETPPFRNILISHFYEFDVVMMRYKGDTYGIDL
jgi:hypothetical protein